MQNRDDLPKYRPCCSRTSLLSCSSSATGLGFCRGLPIRNQNISPRRGPMKKFLLLLFVACLAGLSFAQDANQNNPPNDNPDNVMPPETSAPANQTTPDAGAQSTPPSNTPTTETPGTNQTQPASPDTQTAPESAQPAQPSAPTQAPATSSTPATSAHPA